MKKLLYIIALAVVVATVSAKPRKVKVPTPADMRKAEFLYNHSIPVSLSDSGDVYFELVRQAYTIDTTDRTLQGEYGMLLSILGSSVDNDTTYAMREEGIRLARKAFEANTADLEYGRRYLGFLGKLSEKDLAIDAVRKMRHHDPLNEELLQLAIEIQQPGFFVIDTAMVYNTFELLDTLEMAHGVTPETTAQRASLSLTIDDTVSAVKAVRDFYQQNKSDRKATMLMMKIFNFLGQPDSVINIGTAMFEDAPTDLENVVVLANAYLEKGDTTRYLSILQETMLNVQWPPEILSDLIVAMTHEVMSQEGMTTKGYPMITETYDTLIKAHPYDEKLMKGYLVWLDYTDAKASTAVMEDYINLHPSDKELWNNLISAYINQNQGEKALDAITRAERYFPRSVEFPILKGQYLLTLTPADTAAVEREFARADALANDSTPTDLISSIKGMRADLTVSMGDTIKGIDFYRQALLLKPDNYMLANNLAYILALRKEDLPEARMLIERCIRYNSEEYMWLDTYAWVLFQQGEYKEAAKQIDAAIEAMSNLGNEISAKDSKATYEHAGDIHYMAGDADEAVKNWRRALVYAPGDAGLIRKIRTKKM